VGTDFSSCAIDDDIQCLLSPPDARREQDRQPGE
jgi:hypothetical protein